MVKLKTREHERRVLTLLGHKIRFVHLLSYTSFCPPLEVRQSGSFFRVGMCCSKARNPEPGC